MSLGTCDTCVKAGHTYVVKLARSGTAAWLCLKCGAASVLRAKRLGVTAIEAPQEIWSEVARIVDRETVPPPAPNGWISREQVEWTLRRQAEATAAALGHQLGSWGITMAICSRCNRAAYAVPRTLGPSLSGAVLSMECVGS